MLLVNNQKNIDKKQFEAITGTKVVAQGKVPVVAKKVTTNKKTKKNVKKKKKTTNKTQKNVKKKVVKKKTTKKKTYKQTTRIKYNKSEIQSYARQMVYQYGWTDEDYYSIVMIVNHESSWRPNAVNKKSGSCGLFQAYPCSKMAKYGSDYRTNWKVQMKFGFEYIKARYQTPTKAWAFWQKHHWY